MKLNSQIDRTLTARIRERKYPVVITGHGIPCLSVGIGTLMQRTLYNRFKTHFEVYSSDLYWDYRYRLEYPALLTMEQMIQDWALLAEELKLSSYIILAHSAFGIAALEFAKKNPPSLKGIIMVGTPVNSNEQVAATNQRYFENYACADRKKIDQERQRQFASLDFSYINLSKFLQKYIWQEAPRYWHDPAFDCTPLWKDIQVDDALLAHFFTDILPGHDVQVGLEKIKCPIFLAAGMSDYDCCPWMWEEVKNKPSKMTIHKFEKSGHYPNYEESDLFENKIESWLKELYI